MFNNIPRNLGEIERLREKEKERLNEREVNRHRQLQKMRQRDNVRQRNRQEQYIMIRLDESFYKDIQTYMTQYDSKGNRMTEGQRKNHKFQKIRLGQSPRQRKAP